MQKMVASVVVVGALAVAALGGCADPLLGTWNYSGTSTATVTMPAVAMGTSTSMPMGTLTITAASGGGYAYRFQDSGSGDVCTFTGTRSGNVVTFPANQSCMITQGGTTLTATLTSATAALDSAGTTQAIQANYTFVGSVSGVGVTGTGTENFTATSTGMH